MLGLVKVFRGVFVLGGIATADLSTDQAQTQMHPRVTNFYAFLAFPFVGLFEFNLIEMRALLRHGSSGELSIS